MSGGVGRGGKRRFGGWAATRIELSILLSRATKDPAQELFSKGRTNDTQFNSNLSSPKPGHTTGGSGQGGAERDSGAGRGQRRRDADGLFRPGDNRPYYPPDDRNITPWVFSGSTNKGNAVMQTDWGRKPTVDPRFIRGTAALRSWLLTNVPADGCLYKPFSCKACLVIEEHNAHMTTGL